LGDAGNTGATAWLSTFMPLLSCLTPRLLPIAPRGDGIVGTLSVFEVTNQNRPLVTNRLHLQDFCTLSSKCGAHLRLPLLVDVVSRPRHDY